MAAILSEKAQLVLKYMQDNQSADLTAASIAEALGLEKKSVNGTLTGLGRDSKSHAPLIERVKIDGIDDKVIRLTSAGAAFDVTAEKVEAE